MSCRYRKQTLGFITEDTCESYGRQQRITVARGPNISVGGQTRWNQHPAVRAIRGFDPITPLAGMPDFIRGVIDVRGVIVPIVDVRLKFAPSGAHYDDSAVVFILNLFEHVIGIVVDAVFDVLTFAADCVRREPEFGAPEVQLIDTVVPPPRDRSLLNKRYRQ